MNEQTTVKIKRRLGMWLLTAVILVPCAYGFGTKFNEFIALYRGDAEGAFAISPILNYLLASFGFLLLFFWAAFKGMFHDIERPKHTMLENEATLNRGVPRHLVDLNTRSSGSRPSKHRLLDPSRMQTGNSHEYN